jgi:hypothetical protein
MFRRTKFATRTAALTAALEVRESAAWRRVEPTVARWRNASLVPGTFGQLEVIAHLGIADFAVVMWAKARRRDRPGLVAPAVFSLVITIFILPILVTAAIVIRLTAALTTRRERVRSPGIVRPPGTLLLHLAEFCASRKTYERVYVELIADLQAEYFDAVAAGRRGKASWVRLRGYFSFASTALVTIVRSPLGRLVQRVVTRGE